MDQLSAKQQSGKSYVVKKLITILKEQGKKVIALAPTGIAANNIKGQTIHSFFSLPPFGVFVFAPLKDLK